MTDQPARVPAQASPAATAAYVRIYEEEQPRLVAYARSLTRNTWAAEDLVAEAHFRVWRRLSAGHEIDNVPAYLMTTVRHLASSVASATHETPRDPQIPEQASSGHVEDPAEQVSATDLLVRVLGELPERWVRALWLADAEGQPLESVGRQIGAKQGATAVLLHRAREGMRQAFLRSQTEAPDDPACEVHWVRMPAYVRGNATPRQSERLLAHVDVCDGCRGRLAVLIRANNRLPAIVGPALLVLAVGGGGGAGKVVASLTGSSGGVGVASSGGHGLLRTARAAGPRTKAALASGTAAAAAIAVVLSLGVNESPATVTSPGREPVAQGPVAQEPVTQEPVAGPSEGAVAAPGDDRRVERDADRARAHAAGAAVPEDLGGVQLVAGVRESGEAGESGGSGGSQGAGESGGTGGSEGSQGAGESGGTGGDEGSEGSGSGSEGGGGVGEPTPPQPAPEEPTDPGPGDGPAVPAPGGDEPTLPVGPEQPAQPEEPEQPAQPEPPQPPIAQQPEPEPEPEPNPDPESPEPGTPGDETPVPNPTTPTPEDPDPGEGTPQPPTYSQPPTTPEPTAPTSPEPPQAPVPSQPPNLPADPTPPTQPTQPTQPTPPTVPDPPGDHNCGPRDNDGGPARKLS